MVEKLRPQGIDGHLIKGTSHEEPHIHTTGDLRAEIMKLAPQIEQSVADSRLRFALAKHPEFPSIRMIIPGKKGPPMRFFTPTQAKIIVEEALRIKGVREKRQKEKPTVKVPRQKAALILRKLTPHDHRQNDQGQEIQTATEAPPEDETTRVEREREENFELATLYILSMIVKERIEPTVFANAIDDDEVKKDFISGFSDVLERFWNLDPKNVNGISKVQTQLIAECTKLKHQEYTIREIVQEISGKLKIFPPRRYRAT